MFVFDYTKHSSLRPDATCRPQHRCLGHTAEGYGLAWNPLNAGHLLSGSDDASICIWDINKASGVEVQPLHKLSGHSSVVEDVDWHKHDGNIFGSVGDDGRCNIWDVRDNTGKPKHIIEQAHESEVNCLSFNPFNEYLFATGGSDGCVGLWDMRKMQQKLHALEGHSDGVFQVGWAPFNETILGSCSSDRRMHVWDLSRIGDEQVVYYSILLYHQYYLHTPPNVSYSLLCVYFLYHELH